MRILVTGANGYLGQGIVRELIRRNHQVIASDFSSDYIDQRAIIKKCDIMQLEDPYAYLGNPDVLLHLAWRNGFVHNSETHIEDLAGHYAFIKKMMFSGVKRIAVMGTMHEVGFYEGSIKENTPCNPQSLYGIAKNALRNATFLLGKEANVPIQWIRAFYIVGNSEHGNSVFSKIAAAEKEGKKIFPFNSGQNQYDFIEYDNFCNKVASVVNQNEITGIINVCSGKPMKLSERVEQFLKDNNFKIKLDYGKYPDRPYDSKAVWGDSTKLECILKKEEKQKGV